MAMEQQAGQLGASGRGKRQRAANAHVFILQFTTRTKRAFGLTKHLNSYKHPRHPRTLL